jgi:hypothetical protein
MSSILLPNFRNPSKHLPWIQINIKSLQDSPALVLPHINQMKDPHCRDLDQLVLGVVLDDIGDRTSLEDLVGRKVCLLSEEKM